MTEKLSSEQIKKIKNLEENYKNINFNIENALLTANLRQDVILLAATKTVEPYLINHAIKLGVKYIGENRVQEFLSKYENLDLDDVSTHFIGHLQTNKVKQIISKVDMIESVDNIRVAKEISKQSIQNNLTTDILIEVNIGKEENKSGIYPEKLLDFIYEISEISNINVKGLMAIPPVCDKKSEVKKFFSKIYELFIDISHKKIDNIYMKLLSMGMSGDYEEAISCGANVVRIGSALFGNRFYQ